MNMHSILGPRQSKYAKLVQFNIVQQFPCGVLQQMLDTIFPDVAQNFGQSTIQDHFLKINHYYFSNDEIAQARSMAKKLKTKNELWKQLSSLDAVTETASSEEELELLYAVIVIHKGKCQSC